MGKLKVLLKISRPRFWLYLAGPYLIGFTISAGSKFDFLEPRFFIPLLFFLFPANLILYGVNDIFDQETDSYNPKKKDKENLLTKSQSYYLKTAIAINLILSVTIFHYSENTSHLLIFLMFLLLSVFYSARPIRLKSIPFLDSASNILYGLPAVWGYMQNANSLPPISIWIILFSWNTAMHLFSAIPDIKVDKKTGIRTTAVKLGKNGSLLTCTLLWTIFSFTALYESLLTPFNYLSLIFPTIPLLLLLNKNIKIERVYWFFPYINSLLGFILFWIVAIKKLI